jgi:hypothetical protein
MRRKSGQYAALPILEKDATVNDTARAAKKPTVKIICAHLARRAASEQNGTPITEYFHFE